jgi:hypothetical protein
MKAHFEFPSTITSADIVEFLRTKNLHGFWECDELNLFRLNTVYCDEEYIRLRDLLKEEIEIKGVKIRGFMAMKQRPADWVPRSKLR